MSENKDALESKEFWDNFPTKWQSDPDYDFTNVVAVVKDFITLQSQMAEFSGALEIIRNEIANKKVELDRTERDLVLLRRKILADNYSSITKSASSEIQEAFILKCVTGTPDEASLLALEKVKEEAIRFIEIRKPRIEFFLFRLDKVSQKLEYNKEFVNTEKMIFRAGTNNR